MAKTFYGYAEREVDSFVDWSKIGQDITTMLKTEVDLREQKKAAIDEATRKFEEQLQNAPIGEYTELNDYLSRYSDDATQAMLIQERMLKTGQLKVKDYVLGRDNLISGTNGMFAFAKEFQEVYKQKMDGILSEDPEERLSQRTAHEMELAEGLAKFENTRAVINPTNYKVGIAKTVKNKETGMVELTDEIMSITQMRNILRTNYKVYNVDKNTQAQADSLGALEFDIIDIAKRGGDLTIVSRVIDGTGELLEGEALSDKDKKRFGKIQSDYQEWEKLTIKRMTQNPDDVASILVDGAVVASNGEVYAFTEKESEAKKYANLIYIDRFENQRGVPEIDSGDLGLAQDVLKANIRRKVDRKIQATQLKEKSRSPLLVEKYRQAIKDKEKIESMDKYIKFFKGDDVAKKTVFQSLDNNKGVQNTKIVDEGLNGVYMSYTRVDDKGQFIDDIGDAVQIYNADGEPSSPLEVAEALFRNEQLMSEESDAPLAGLSSADIADYLERNGFENPDQRYVYDEKGRIVYEAIKNEKGQIIGKRKKSRINLSGLAMGKPLTGMTIKAKSTRRDVITKTTTGFTENIGTPITEEGTGRTLYDIADVKEEMDRLLPEKYILDPDGTIYNISDGVDKKKPTSYKLPVTKDGMVPKTDIVKIINVLLAKGGLVDPTTANTIYEGVATENKYTGNRRNVPVNK